MNIKSRLIYLMLVDMLLISISVYSSYLFRFDGHIPPYYVEQCMQYAGASMVIGAISMIYFRLYNRIWEYASVGEMITIVKAVIVGCVVSYLFMYVISGHRVPASVYVRVMESVVLLLGASRFGWRIVRDKYYKIQMNQNRALIVGAGDCGILIAKEMKFNSGSSMYPIGFIDDDLAKHRHQVMGLPVLGGRDRILEIVEQRSIDEIIIAMPSISKKEISTIIDICKMTKARLKIIPNISHLIQGKVTINEIRDVQVEDLLGRDPIHVDLVEIANYVENKTVLVTGAGGSIGSELCRQIARFHPGKLLLLGHGENSIYDIEKEMLRKYPYILIESIIADVQDKERMNDVFKTHLPKVVFHAAAHKHVPLMEKNPAEAIKNNVFGTKNVAECADLYQAERFVLISTDKAVNPTSIMGATKRIAEMFIQSLDLTSQTKFVAVRFGNVLGSRGSVIPAFKEQIAMGGPLTVTHPDMVRYFMTIPEAVQLVIQAGAFAEGGEVFILDMGSPVKIVDLASSLIRFSGLEPGVDIEIAFTGIRPGEKLFEELLLSQENISTTRHDRIFIGQPMEISRSELELEIKRLERVVGEEQRIICDVVRHIVPTYSNAG